MIGRTDTVVEDEGIKPAIAECEGDGLPLSFVADDGITAAGDNEHSGVGYTVGVEVEIDPYALVGGIEVYSLLVHLFSPVFSFIIHPRDQKSKWDGEILVPIFLTFYLLVWYHYFGRSSCSDRANNYLHYHTGGDCDEKPDF